MGQLDFYDTAGKRQRIHTEVPDDTTYGGMLVLFRILLAINANADHDVIMRYKTRIIDAWVVIKNGSGTAGSTVTFKSTGSAISNAIDCSSASDTDILRATTWNDGTFEIPANGILRVATASNGGDFPGAEAYALGIRVA